MRPIAITLSLVSAIAFTGAAAGSAATSASGQLSVYRHGGVSFSYPSAWKHVSWCWAGTMNRPLVVLTTARTAPTCNDKTPFPPVQHLGRNGVSVWWAQVGRPGMKWLSMVKGSPTTRVGGQPARAATFIPTSQEWRATGCKEAGGNFALVTQVRPTDLPNTFYWMTACLRGPHLASSKAAVRKLLASASFSK